MGDGRIFLKNFFGVSTLLKVSIHDEWLINLEKHSGSFFGSKWRVSAGRRRLKPREEKVLGKMN